MFNQINTVRQGGLGLARAVYEYQKLGYNTCIPLIDAQDYDLVIEKDGIFKSVQCKTTTMHARLKNGVYSEHRYSVGLRNIRTNTKETTVKYRGKYDLLFVLCDNDVCYSIPAILLPQTNVLVGGPKYEEYKL